MARTFSDLVAEAAEVPVDGWDFSWLDGRATEQRPSWGYQRLLASKLATVSAAVDLNTGGGEVLAGVEQALGLGLASVKVNAVLLRDLNDAALPQWLDYVRERALTVRFIELMQTGTNHGYFRRHHLRADALQQQLLDAGWQLQPRAVAAGPACDYAHPDFLGRIGIIAPYAPGFCASCNRLRVTSSGDLRMVINNGVISRSLMEILGLNVGNYLVAQLFGDDVVGINCAAADVGIRDGVAAPRLFVFDTENAIINISGNTNFATERLDLSIDPESKGMRVLTLRSPLYVKGTFAHPDAGVKAGPLIARGAAAVALGVVLTPAAALLALVSPSEGGEENQCGKILQQMKQKK